MREVTPKLYDQPCFHSGVSAECRCGMTWDGHPSSSRCPVERCGNMWKCVLRIANRVCLEIRAHLTSIVCCDFSISTWVLWVNCSFSMLHLAMSQPVSLSDDSGRRRSLQSRFQQQSRSLLKPAICLRYFQTTLYVSKRLRNHALSHISCHGKSLCMCVCCKPLSYMFFPSGKKSRFLGC